MKGVDTISRVRREHFVRHRSIREVSRDLHLSRNTVRKILRSEATEFHHERDVQPLPMIGPWREQLDCLLMANEGKASRERLTLIRCLRNSGTLASRAAMTLSGAMPSPGPGSRGAVTAEAYVPLSFAGGEAYQFDWSHETVRVKVAHGYLAENPPSPHRKQRIRQ